MDGFWLAFLILGGLCVLGAFGDWLLRLIRTWQGRE